MTSTETDTQTSELDAAFADVTQLFQSPPLHTINVPKALAVLDLIETRPDLHEQEVWATVVEDETNIEEATRTIDQAKELGLGACNTAGCFAGWTAALDGHTVGTVGDLAGVLIEASLAQGMTVEWHLWNDDYPEDGYLSVTGKTIEADDYARRVLGLTEEQAEMLFAGGNSRDMIRQYLSDWTHGEIPRYRPGA